MAAAKISPLMSWVRANNRLIRNTIAIREPEAISSGNMQFKGEFDGSDPEKFETFEAMWSLAKETCLAMDPVPMDWNSTQRRAGLLLMGLRGSAAVFAWRLSEEERKDDVKLLGLLRDKFLDKRSETAYQREWKDIKQRQDEEFDDFYARVSRAFKRAYRTLEIPNNVMDRFIAEKFRDSLFSREVTYKLLELGIIEQNGNAKAKEAIMELAKRALDLESSKEWKVESENRERVCLAKAGGPRPIQGRNWFCLYCHTRDHTGGWKVCKKRERENPSWRPQRARRSQFGNRQTRMAVIKETTSSDEYDSEGADQHVSRNFKSTERRNLTGKVQDFQEA